ncbi:phenylacetate--CoA ligase family protein [Natrialba swarupiae]|uniref:Phenylacetate--CoA ligase n=1 Tax=Natrialba swarupiae TaxID=2448032 RepID=A0A5D5AKZ8_9EURY|nr:phenylacetate--CoA ligase [Natrialba swarupiae]TYT60422.1 phenylacetate--CoA ligase [Natrialba swarupiae]
MGKTYHDIETHSWEEVRRRHEDKLPGQLAYLGENSDFYQRKFSEWDVDVESVSTIEEFQEIPFTTKDDQRRNQADPPEEQPLGTHQAVPTEELSRTISSSGTTGKPTYFGLTKSDRRSWNEVMKRSFYCAGIDPDDTVIFGSGQTMITGGTPYFEALTELGANVVPAGGESTERLLSVMTDLPGDALITTTSHHRYLTERIPELGFELDELSITKLVGGGGPGIGNPEIRSELYEQWGANLVREGMGMGDVIGCMWSECEFEDGMHYHGQGHAHVELIDTETGENVPFEVGSKGELVYTPLEREATPLLRFKSGDYARVTGVNCQCGRTSPKIRCIGRADDMVIYKGMNVFPSAIRDVVSGVEGAMGHTKVIVPTEDKVHFEAPIPIEAVLDPETDRDEAAVEDDIVDAVRTQLKVRVRPQLVDFSEIELSEYKTEQVIVRK